ncbi:DUF4192 domain-containing protein [Paraoerskovia marina]|uniref:DUF4192 domain-containing protein n=1 Tax=Paraoerskovia marina TaxID=545619 RepID=UPI000492C888|nr:DUF4192 domain-containing protein [Paraoerskovia marina]
MDTTIRVENPAELIAYIPHRLGFRPAGSIVVVSLRPSGGRVGLVARMDLDDVEKGGATLLAQHMRGDGAERVVQVVYDDREPRPDARAWSVAHRVEKMLAAVVVDVVTWWVSPHGYGCLDCEPTRCCPEGGRPLTDLESTEVGAHMVVAGSSVADSRDAAFALPAVEPARRRSVVAALRRARLRRATAEPDWRRDGLESWRRAVGSARADDEVPPATIGRVAAALEDIRVRDAVLLHLVRGDADLVDKTAAGSRAGDVADRTGAAIAAIVDPDVGIAPPEESLRPRVVVLEQVAASTCAHPRAAAGTLLALVAWWQGDGGRAGERLREALEADPEYRLARLLDAALSAGLAPGWLRSAR